MKMGDAWEPQGHPHMALHHMLLLTQRAALKLEVLGMKHSSGRSVCAFVKKHYGIRGRTKAEVLENFEAWLKEKGVLK